MLYDRDFNILTSDEKEKITAAEAFKAKTLVNGEGWSTEDFYKYHELLPQVAHFHNSLFPNNLLHPDSLRDKEVNERIKKDFTKLLDSEITERDILNFINENKFYNIIGSIFQGYLFGHHQAYMFKEFELTSTYKADYLLIGKSSGGYSFIFIELENPYGQITTKSGEFGSTFRKGITQVEDWDSWIEANYSSLRLIFDKYKNPRIELPKEFFILDKSRLNYVVIAGRRTDFNEKTYEKKRKFLKRNNINIMHYDNLFDNFENLLKERNY